MEEDVLSTEGILTDLVNLIQSGKPMPAGSSVALVEALNHYQAKLDLLQTGVVLHEMRRLPDLIGRVRDVEATIFSRFSPEISRLDMMENKDLIALLKALHGEYRNTVAFTAQRAVNPMISSTETMRQVPEQGVSQVEAPRLSAVSRENVRNYLSKLTNKMAVIEAEIVKTPTKKAKPKPKKKAKPKKKVATKS